MMFGDEKLYLKYFVEACKKGLKQSKRYLRARECITIQVKIYLFRYKRESVKWLANSTLDQKVVCLNLVFSKIPGGNRVTAMPGSMPAPNSGSLGKVRKI
jgi:hypothetical protein